MKIESPAFKNGERIPVKYTCDGEDVNPPLFISGVPENAISLSLTVDDPDSPTGTWIHWMMTNISPDTKEISENSLPQGAIEHKNSFGKTSYGGPCPHGGTHRYFFKLEALDSGGNIVARAETMGTYSR